MLRTILAGALLANSVVALHAQAQPPVKPAPAVLAPEPAEKIWPPEGVLVLDKSLKAPALISEVKPSYTAAAMRERIQGVVEVQAVVLTDGSVGAVRVVESLDRDFGLDEQAVEAVKQWRFRPGQKDGEAVPVMVNIELTFTVKSGR